MLPHHSDQMSERSLRKLCDGPETPTQRKSESVTAWRTNLPTNGLTGVGAEMLTHLKMPRLAFLATAGGGGVVGGASLGSSLHIKAKTTQGRFRISTCRSHLSAWIKCCASWEWPRKQTNWKEFSVFLFAAWKWTSSCSLQMSPSESSHKLWVITHHRS